MSFVNKIMNKAKKGDATPPKSNSGDAVQPKVESKSQQAKDQAPTAEGASLQKAMKYIESFKSRRTIYALGKEKVLEDKEIIDLIEACVRESPSSFNSQSSRVVILFGQDHESHWEGTVLEALKKVTGEEGVAHAKPKLEGFKGAYGTALFFEDEEVIKGMQEKFPQYAQAFPKFSLQSSGMAQIHTWTTLELAGFGCNLQHYSNLVEEPVAEKYNLPKSWKLHAEMVFGSIKAPAGEKTYMDDAERFKIFGSS